MVKPYFIPATALDQAVLAMWTALLPAEGKLLGASLFGDLFVERASGEVDMLDIVSGRVTQVAVCQEEFEWDLTQRGAQEELLMGSLADAAMSAGKSLGPGECFAFRTPPMLGGQLAPENLVAWNFIAYHSGLAKLFAQITDLPLGTQVVLKPPRSTS